MKNVEEYSYNLLKNFIVKFPNYYESMNESMHGDLDNGYFPQYHLGESVWTHTMMVYSHMISEVKNVNYNEKELLIAALLHDIGKPSTRFLNEKKQKYVFYGHDSVSTFLALDVIQKIDPEITEEQKIYILKLINYHQILFNVNEEMSEKAVQKLTSKFHDADLFRNLMILRFCDFSGNISKTPQNTSLDKFYEIFDNIKEPDYFDNTLPVCTLMVGLPGSGKSTYVKNNYSNQRVLSRDNLVLTVGKTDNYREAWKNVDQNHIDRLYEANFSTRLKQKEDFVIDKTNLSHKSRMKSIYRLEQHGFRVKIKVFLPPYQTIVDRNAYRTFYENKEIPIEVIHNMMKTFDMPFANEGEVEYIF